MTESEKPSKPARKKPKRRIISTRFKEFSARMLPITMIILGLAIIFTGIAYFISREPVQYWFLLRNPNIFGFLLVNLLLFPFVLTRIAAICFAGAGLMLVIYGVSFYLLEEKSGIQKISMIAGFLLGSLYLLLLSIAGILMNTVWLYDQVIFQIALFGLPLNVGTGVWPYLLLIGAIILLILTFVKWIIPDIEEGVRNIVFPLATIAVWLLAFAEWTKGTLATTQLPQFASITLLPSSLFMGEALIEGAALIALGIGMILKLIRADEKESIRYVFTAMAGLVYGIALVHQILLLWAFSLTVFWLIAIILAVIAGIFIVLNGEIYFRDCVEKI